MESENIAFSDDMIRSRLAGMNAHLAKPLDRKKLWKQYKNAYPKITI